MSVFDTGSVKKVVKKAVREEADRIAQKARNEVLVDLLNNYREAQILMPGGLTPIELICANLEEMISVR